MTRTKWMRLKVRDLSEAVRWASAQNARDILDMRYRVIRRRETLSFRMVPNYQIKVGTREIVVVCHVRASAATFVANRLAAWRRRLVRRAVAAPAPQKLRPPAEVVRPLQWAGAKSPTGG